MFRVDRRWRWDVVVGAAVLVEGDQERGVEVVGAIRRGGTAVTKPDEVPAWKKGRLGKVQLGT